MVIEPERYSGKYYKKVIPILLKQFDRMGITFTQNPFSRISHEEN